MKKGRLKLATALVIFAGLLLTGAWLLWRNVNNDTAYRQFVLLTKAQQFNLIKIPHTTAIANTNDQTETFSAKLLFMGDTMLARTIGQGITGDNPYMYIQSTLNEYNF